MGGRDSKGERHRRDIGVPMVDGVEFPMGRDRKGHWGIKSKGGRVGKGENKGRKGEAF